MHNPVLFQCLSDVVVADQTGYQSLVVRVHAAADAEYPGLPYLAGGEFVGKQGREAAKQPLATRGSWSSQDSLPCSVCVTPRDRQREGIAASAFAGL